MEYLTVSQFAGQHSLSERTVHNWCATGKIEGVFLIGKTWNIPVGATLPLKGKAKVSPLSGQLQKAARLFQNKVLSRKPSWGNVADYILAR